MVKIHKRFTTEQITLLFKQYQSGDMTRSEIQEILGIGKTRLFKLLSNYVDFSDVFRIEYQRTSKSRVGPDIEEKIVLEL